MDVGFPLLTPIDMHCWQQILHFSSRFSRGSKETLIPEIMVGGKYPYEIPNAKPHKVNKRKSHSCICLILEVFFPSPCYCLEVEARTVL